MGLTYCVTFSDGHLIRGSTVYYNVQWIRWHSQAHVLLAGTSDGGGWMWKLPSGDCKMFQGPNVRNTCCALLGDGRRVACGYEDGTVKVWNLKEGTPLISVAPPLGHSASVTSLTINSDSALLLSGSEDSTAKLTNVDSGKVRLQRLANYLQT